IVGVGVTPSVERRSQVYAYTPGPEHIGQSLDLLQVLRALGTPHRLVVTFGRVDVGQHDAVDAERRVGASVSHVVGRQRARQLTPFPNRTTGVAPFDGAVEIVPVIEQAVFYLGSITERK